ncbi:1-acyl-sn-glycerol-3-phosphate acyltransferase delta [Aplysia californica]|uniref:1-acyl-sn-glycerol-3-phosphate acyltransferase delta n=1 Tax=Aplysia californica TaxID=6500 RepID=A0ABM0K8P1_APLCA|nr:1-acyl-sn-glycerol-3-phosphate acyltransferase delta [Aplysia californica]XP_035829083.1 1-acyl-sn-glycerol-3-phosphate acyltransferase delta [Aplysia californica]
MGLIQQFKSLLVVQLVIGYIFVVSGLIVTFLMLCSCVIWPFNRHLYRKVNVHLAYAHWSQFTFLAQWWSGTEVILYAKEEDVRHVGKEHVLTIMNHKYDIDWLMAWILAERFQMLGNTKIYGKQFLKYVPLIGWAWYFTESIFLKRQWEHDKKIIETDLRQATDYPEGYYVTLLLFPEGTRFTEEKHRASLEVCRAKGYPELKHVLLPRPKGFIVSMHGLRGHFPTILNCTVGFPRDGPAPTLMNVVSGRPLLAHFHAERIPIDSVPVETDEQCAAWLRQLFKRKDDLYDSFLQTGKFPGHSVIIPRRTNDLVMWLFWAVVLCVPLFQYLGGIFIAGTLLQQLTVVGVIVLASVVVRWMIGVTEIHKGSSYGRESEKQVNKKSE